MGGIVICDKGKSTYIYLCGIKPIRTIHIGDDIELVPAESSPNPDDMIDSIMKNGSGSEFELGVLIATLRNTTATLKVSHEDAKELAVLTWNTQWICVYISALLNCEISWYFQADSPVNEFNALTKINMIHNNMYKFPNKCTIIEEKACVYLEESIVRALRLGEDERFATASNALWSYRWNSKPAVQLSVLWGGIESLFLIERGIKSKLSLSASRFLLGNDDMVNEIRALYEARSKAVHELKNGDANILEKSAKLLQRLLVKCIEKKDLPRVEELLELRGDSI